MENTKKDVTVGSDAIWDLLIQLSGLALFLLLVVAYFTGEEFPHTHAMIGYAIASLLAVSVFWAIVRPRRASFPPAVYTPRGIKAQFQNATGLPRTLAPLFLIMAALPLCALLLMVLTHTLWGATWIDEMHEVVAYFAVGLVVVYIVMVGLASSGFIENRAKTWFK